MTNATVRRKYGVSIGSLVPWSYLTPWAVWLALRIAQAAGFDGIQVLPLRGWGGKLYKYEDFALSAEGAWNWGSLRTAIRRLFRRVSKGPTLLDLVLFREEVGDYIPGIPFVANNWKSGVVTETHYDSGTNLPTYVYQTSWGRCICWDTFHVREKLKKGAWSHDWRWLLHNLSPDAVALIHVHVTRDEMNAFLAGDETLELVEMLRALNDKFPGIPAIIEVAPFLFKTPWGLINTLSALREKTKLYLG